MMISCEWCGVEYDPQTDNEADGTRHRCKPGTIVRTQGCDQCDRDVPVVVVGEPYDWETSTALVCSSCLEVALAILREQIPARCECGGGPWFTCGETKRDTNVWAICRGCRRSVLLRVERYLPTINIVAPEITPADIMAMKRAVAPKEPSR